MSGFEDVQVSWWGHWECGTCGAHGEVGPVEHDETYDGSEIEHDCEAGE